MEIKLEKRTEKEIKAYVDGYNACFDRFVSALSQMEKDKAIKEMELLKKSVNSALKFCGETKNGDY